MFPGACLDEAIGDDGLAAKGLVKLPIVNFEECHSKGSVELGFQNTEQTDQSKLIQKQLGKPCGGVDNSREQAYQAERRSVVNPNSIPV